MHDTADVAARAAQAVQAERGCSVCIRGICRTPQACQVPLPELPVRIERRLFTERRDLRQLLRRIAVAIAAAAALLANHHFTKGL